MVHRLAQRVLALACCAVAGVLVAMAPAPAQAAPGLSLGFMDGDLETLSGAGELDAGLRNARASGATVWRFGIVWRHVAPDKPPSHDLAKDPDWSGYNWFETDRIVRAVRAAGMRPMAVVSIAPDWALGPNAPEPSARMRAGAWKPSSSWFRSFAVALARRYSGEHPDPLAPAENLPRIDAWEPWNEPNLSLEISPQWVKRGGRWRAESPRIYRRLHNAFYSGMKSVDRDMTIIAGATAPYGDPGHRDRMRPLRFWKELLCVRSSKTRKRTKGCAGSLRFDAISHHPYPIGPPRRKARHADDVTVPDVGKIVRLIRPAVRVKTARPATTRKPLWITEISWDSAPDPTGLSQRTHATYLQASLYVLWRQGARVITWFQMRDQAPRPSFAATHQSGIFERSSTPAEDVAKPARTAFRFPFTAYRSSGVARLWGKAPRRGRVTVEARRGGRWVTAARLTAASNHIFTGRLRVGPGTNLRARSGDDTSLTWTVR